MRFGQRQIRKNLAEKFDHFFELSPEERFSEALRAYIHMCDEGKELFIHYCNEPHLHTEFVLSHIGKTFRKGGCPRCYNAFFHKYMFARKQKRNPA